MLLHTVVALTTGVVGLQPGSLAWAAEQCQNHLLKYNSAQPVTQTAQQMCAGNGASGWPHQRQLGNLTFLGRMEGSGREEQGGAGKGSGFGALQNLKCPAIL